MSMILSSVMYKDKKKIYSVDTSVDPIGLKYNSLIYQ